MQWQVSGAGYALTAASGPKPCGLLIVLTRCTLPANAGVLLLPTLLFGCIKLALPAPQPHLISSVFIMHTAQRVRSMVCAIISAKWDICMLVQPNGCFVQLCTVCLHIIKTLQVGNAPATGACSEEFSCWTRTRDFAKQLSCYPSQRSLIVVGSPSQLHPLRSGGTCNIGDRASVKLAALCQISSSR